MVLNSQNFLVRISQCISFCFIIIIILLGPAQKSLFKMHPHLLTGHSIDRCRLFLPPAKETLGCRLSFSLINDGPERKLQMSS